MTTYSRWGSDNDDDRGRPWRPLAECVPGALYALRSRNLSCGVYDGNRGFIGIREKFGDLFLFTEYYAGDDADGAFGTAWPYDELAVCPLPDYREFIWVDPDDKVPEGFILSDYETSATKRRFARNSALFKWLTPFDDVQNRIAREDWQRYRDSFKK